MTEIDKKTFRLIGEKIDCPGHAIVCSCPRCRVISGVYHSGILLAKIAVVTMVGLVAGCGSQDLSYAADEGEPMPKQTVEQVQARHSDEWMAIPGVQGIAVGLSAGKPCILILSSMEARYLREKIPCVVEGFPVIITESGLFHSTDR